MKKKVILSIAAILAAISLTGCTQKDITHDFCMKTILRKEN